jgi:hypothetical protein
MKNHKSDYKKLESLMNNGYLYIIILYKDEIIMEYFQKIK